MNNRNIVRNPPVLLLFGVLFIGFSVCEFVYGLSESDVTKRNSCIIFGILGAVIGIAVLVMCFMVKYEYDDKGFAYTNSLGKTREISYDEIFGLMYTSKNTLRVELSDGTAISISTATKQAKEFARVLEAAYVRKSQAAVQMPANQ
ncbi:MAG: hypothetical protein IKR76_06860 [Ruminococcus sp.]|nr:hypothetical protein [Ruminococcus sp.]